MREHRAGPASAPGYGVTWGGPPRAPARALTVAAATAVVAGTAGPAVASTTTPGAVEPVGVIVREAPGAGDRPEQAVVAALRALPGVLSVDEVRAHLVLRRVRGLIR